MGTGGDGYGTEKKYGCPRRRRKKADMDTGL